MEMEMEEEEQQQQQPRPWVILGRIPRVVPGDAQAAAAAGDEDAARAADFSFPVVLPPRVTVMKAFPTAHPDPNNPDKYPYILGVSADYILLNFGVRPYYGVCLDDRPVESNLIVVRNLDASGVEQRRPPTGTAERIQLRDKSKFAVVSNLESIGILATPNSAQDYIIAELMVDKGSDTVKLVYIFSDSDKWNQEVIPNPLPDVNREWVPSCVVAHGEMLWWFDLSWGIISFDPYDGLDVPLLLFHSLPEDSALDMTVPGIHDHRCVTESGGELLYVEIIPEGEFGPAVCMWTRTSAGDGNNETIGWDAEHLLSFEEIWNDDTYEETGLPRKVPVLAAVSPSSTDLVYFVLEERLFGVDLLHCTISEFVDEDYNLVTPWPAAPSCRYVLPWYLPQEVAKALGMDPGDLDGSSAEQLAEDVQDGVAIDVEEMQEDKIHEDEQMAVDIDDILKEDFLEHDVPQVLAEVHAANAQAQAQAQAQALAQEPSTDDEELEEEELDEEEEQQPEEIDEVEQQPEEIDLEEQLAEEIDEEQQPSEEIDEEEEQPEEIEEQQPSEEIDEEEQPSEEIDEEEQPSEEIDEEEQWSEEIHTDEPSSEEMLGMSVSSEEMLGMDLDRSVASEESRTDEPSRADVTEHFSDKEKDHPGPSQDPGDDAGEGAF